MSARTLRFHNDPVAQLDRVSVSEAGGHEFESHYLHWPGFPVKASVKTEVPGTLKITQRQNNCQDLVKS